MAGSTRRLEFKVGILIVAGLAATVILILVSDRISFERYYHVTAYLDNAGGLRVGSPVTLSGIRIGDVESIVSAKDPRGTIKVTMSVGKSHPLPTDYTLQISTSGIFGDSFLAFTGGTDPKAGSLPTDDSAVVKASPGFLDEASQQAKQIMASLTDLLSQDLRQDTKRLMHNAADLAGETAGIAKDLHAQTMQLSEVLTGIQELSGDLRKTSTALGKQAEQTFGGIDRSLANLDQQTAALVKSTDAVTKAATGTMAKVDRLVEQGTLLVERNQEGIQGVIAGLEVLAHRSANVLADLQSGRGVLGQLLVNRELAEDVNQMAINATTMSEILAEHPEALVFGYNQAAAAQAKQRRETLRMRRAFSEGFYKSPPLDLIESPAAPATKAPVDKAMTPADPPASGR